MNLRNLTASAAIILTLTTTAVFAMPDEAAPKNEENRIRHKQGHRNQEEFEKNPIKVLESRKEKVMKLQKEGKLTKEKADEIINRIDSKILKFKEFEKLPLATKKEKLLKDCETCLGEMIKEGKVEQKDAEIQFKEYVEKINNWDGTGYPMFHGKPMKEKQR